VTATNDEPASTHKRLPAEERRRLIVDAARAVFMERGFSGGRTREIAERAQVTEAFLYRHFESKEAMYRVAILDPVAEGFNRLAGELEQLADEENDRRIFTYEMNRRLVSFFVEIAPLMTVALYSELGNGRVFFRQSLEHPYERIGKAITKGAGWEARGLNPTTVRRAVLGSHWAIGMDFTLRKRDVDVDRVARRLTRLFVTGVSEKEPS
jgi:AcrR family transcriptional regulator